MGFVSPFLASLAFLLPLALYIKTLAPTYIPIDSAELALCMHFWGICHPPGFPLFILIGKIFTGIFPFGSLIWRANLLSAVFGSATVLLVYLILVRLKLDKKIALLLSLVLAVSPVFWEFSLAADVFTFATFLIALTFFLVFKNKPFWAFLALGLSASHFYISAILLPIIYWYFWGFKIQIRKLALAFALFVLGFWPQLLMYARMQQSPAVNWGHAAGLGGFIDFIRREEFGSIFLLANPVLTFSPLKVFKHFYIYFGSLLVSFGIVLPILSLATLVFGRILRDRRAILSLLSFLVIVAVQLILLSTIDPTGEDNPFQINKFYLVSYVLAVFLAGFALKWAQKKIFVDNFYYPRLLLTALIVVYFLAGAKINNYSNNYFSQDLVADAMEQLPAGSVAITVGHIFYFGGLYEQKINGQFGGIDLLYFPNEKNRDNEKYHPQLFNRPVNWDFVKTIEKTKTLGKAEGYILETIARNLDREIYILQGTFEEGFFAYLKPYLVPWGLWWKVEPNLGLREGAEQSAALLESLRSGNLKYADLHLRQEQLDLLTYAVSYHSTGIALAGEGKYDQAIAYLKRSFEVRPKGDKIHGEIELIKKTKSAEENLEVLSSQGDKTGLTELGNNYFTLGNYEACTWVFGKLTQLDSAEAKNFSNLASCQASQGKKAQARTNYLSALDLDPNLELARKGLEALEE